MKKTRLLSVALCIGAVSIFACGSGESKDNMSDTATTQENVTPAPTDTTHSMADTSMTDTTKKKP